MRKLEDIKGVLGNLYDDIEEILFLCVNVKFDYLGIKGASWEDLFVILVEGIFNENIEKTEITDELFRRVNIVVKNYIKGELKEEKVRVCNNLLIKLCNKYKGGNLLRNYVYEIEYLGISFINEVYDLMKKKSPLFRKLLGSLGLINYSKEELVYYLNSQFQFEIKIDPQDEKTKKSGQIDYREISEKYSNLTFEEIKELFGDDFDNLSYNMKNLLARYFAPISNVSYVSAYDVEKELNLLIYGYKRKSTDLDKVKLSKVYMDNKDKFSFEQALFIECFILGLTDKSFFNRRYPNGVSFKSTDLLDKLERLYFGIEDIFNYTLTKSQYLKVLELYPEEVKGEKRELLDLYYGVNGEAKTTTEISILYKKSEEKMRTIIWRIRRHLLSLYSKVDGKINVDKDTYIPYILDKKYELNSEVRKVLKLFFIDNLTYEEIALKLNKKSREVAELVSRGLQKIDTYRFGIDRPISITHSDLNEYFNAKSKDKIFERAIRLKYEEFLDNDRIAELLGVEKSKVNRISSDFKSDFINFRIKDIELSLQEIETEINRHSTDSVLTDIEKAIISYYLGLKTVFNPNGEKKTSKEINKKLAVSFDISRKNSDILNKIKRRKINDLTPELIYIERDRLVEILKDSHLPISIEDREIICYLLELNGYPLKSCKELSEMYPVNEKGIKRKYQMAIININKYLLGEKDGLLSFDIDIVPILKYFTSSERSLIIDYYRDGLSYTEIAKKYSLSNDKVKAIMYRIKTSISSIINDSSVVRFDFDYYHEVVDMPNFPFRGDLEQAKRIFDLYVGDTSIGRKDIEEIKGILCLSIKLETISRIIDSLVLAVFKYKAGVRKENGFTLAEVREAYELNKDFLSEAELKLFNNFFNKNIGIDFKMSEDLIYLLIRNKYSSYFKVSDTPKNTLVKMFKKYQSLLSIKTRESLMFLADLSERDLMSKVDVNHVFKTLTQLDRKLSQSDANKRIR